LAGASIVASHGRSASGSLSARRSDRTAARDRSRDRTARHLLLLGDQIGQVAILEAGLAIGVLLGPLLGHAHQQVGDRQQRRAAGGAREGAVDLRGLAGLGEGLLELRDRLAYASLPGFAAHARTFSSSCALGLERVAAGEAGQRALLVLERVLDELLEHVGLDRGHAALGRQLGQHVVELLDLLDAIRVRHVDVELHLGVGGDAAGLAG
jgi:hypothetical protein